jgi:hypothetical protein
MPRVLSGPPFRQCNHIGFEARGPGIQSSVTDLNIEIRGPEDGRDIELHDRAQFLKSDEVDAVDVSWGRCEELSVA